MPRKYFRKIIPSHDTVREHRALRWLGPALRHPNLWHVNRHSISGGVAVGLFTGLIPGSNPVHPLAAALASLVLRVNLPVAVFTTLYSNPFTIVPLYAAAYGLGSLVAENDRGRPPVTELHLLDLPLAQWLPALADWLAQAGKPLLIGLPLLAALLATLGYFSMQAVWHAHVRLEWRQRKLKRRKEKNGD